MLRFALATLLVAMAAALALGAFEQNGDAGTPSRVDDPPCLPGGRDEPGQEDRAPDMAALFADKSFTVAALFGRMDEGSIEEDKGLWSRRQFESYLRSIGFEEIGAGSGQQWRRFVGSIGQGITVQVDILGPSSLSPIDANDKVGEAIASALRSHELVYYNGHSMRASIGQLRRADTFRSADESPGDYGILVLDSCWSTQLYSHSARVAAAEVRRLDILSNDTVSVTGSVHSFVALFEGLISSASKSKQTRWQSHLQRMNALAQARAVERRSTAAESRFPRPEKYRLVETCGTPGGKSR